MKFMKYIILGILQGVTEPLPISSSGHIFLFKSLFNTNMFNDFNLEIFLNFASFIAILLIFRKEVWELIVGFFDYLFKKNKKAKDLFNYCLLIIVGTIPVGLLGLLLKEPLENLLYKNVFLVGIGFLLTAVSLIVVMNSDGKKEDKDLTVKDALIVGLIQAIALTPGISRSGMTLVGCLLCGLSKKTSLKFYEKLVLKNLLLNFKSKPNFIAYELDGVNNLSVKLLKGRNYPIISWTIENEEDMKKAYESTDNIIFDNILP